METFVVVGTGRDPIVERVDVVVVGIDVLDDVDTAAVEDIMVRRAEADGIGAFIAAATVERIGRFVVVTAPFCSDVVAPTGLVDGRIVIN